MQKSDGHITFSPSDLINFLQCDFVSWMDRFYLEFPDRATPDSQEEIIQTIFARGEEHENEYVTELKAAGIQVSDLSGHKGALEPTLRAMRSGDEVIYQAYLAHGEFAGYADFLVRVPGRSKLGDWHYEVQDAKLSRDPKPYFLVQLCCYAEMLEALQGRRPEQVAVVLGTAKKEVRRFRTDDFFYFYSKLKDSFLALQYTFDPASPPSIKRKEDFGRWSSHVEKLLEQQDHLCRVANITKLQIVRLQKDGITTMAALAEASQDRVKRMLPSTFDRLRTQARLQIASHGKDRPTYELIPPDPHDPRRGLALLPPVNDGDVFFDLEGYPLVEGGLEYLFGACYFDSGRIAYRDWWGHDRDAEQAAFAQFVKWIHARWKANSGMHVYHYAAYEETAIRRLLRRYPGICEDQVDDLLRNEVFVDLHTVVRQSLIVGEPRYSLKNIEHLYRAAKREGDITEATDSIVAYDKWLREKDGEQVETSAKLQAIRDYNREDCESTIELANWLREIQAKHNLAFILPTSGLEEKTRELTEPERLARELLADIPPTTERDAAPERWRLQDLLANLLLFHRREDKPMWWAMFARHEMTEEQLAEDLDCLSGLERTRTPPEQVKRSLLYEYRFDPDQDTKLDVGSNCILTHDLTCKTSIERLDRDSGLLAIKFGMTRPAPPNRISLIPYEYVNAGIITDSILKTVKHWRATGALPSAIADFLHRNTPRIQGRTPGPIIPAGADLVDGTTAAVVKLQDSTLTVQGPPGTGKTYTGARAILALIRAGRRVGVSANSHKAINTLLNEVARVASREGVAIRGIHVWRDPSEIDLLERGLNYVSSVKDLPPLQQLHIIGGTAWCFSAPELEDALSHLFVDEAGQVSIANIVGMGRSVSNLVLLGDQMQLNQPIQGSHPGESGQSCLEYLLQGRDTIPDDFGIFLAITRRMHPKVCSFASGICYEDRLRSFSETERRVLVPNRARIVVLPAGLLFVPVEHEGNSQGSDEEVDQIAELIDDLLKRVEYQEGDTVRKFTPDDILIIAPYNMQVRKLKRRFPALRIGTVDKFQGQEAPVVIYSMCASSSEECPRGIDFLFSRNRTNVAVSRSKSLAIVVASPTLIRADCPTVARMRLANIFCRIVVEGRSAPSVAALAGTPQ